MKDNNYFHSCLLTMNGLQDRTPYDGHPVGNIPKFMPLDSIRNIDILHSFRFHCVYHKTAQEAMKMNGMQDASIEAII